MLAKRPPLSLFQTQTFGGVYASDIAVSMTIVRACAPRDGSDRASNTAARRSIVRERPFWDGAPHATLANGNAASPHALSGKRRPACRFEILAAPPPLLCWPWPRKRTA